MANNYNSLKSFDGKVTDHDFNRLVDALQSVTLSQGVGYKLLQTAAGVTLQLTEGGGAVAKASCPFTAKVRTDSDDNVLVTVSPGTVNGLIPSNIFDDFDISDTGTYYVRAVALTDGTAVTSVSLEVDSSEPDAQAVTQFSLPTSIDILLAIIVDKRVYRTIACGSVEMIGHQEFITDKDSPAQPGELVYIPYYRWANSSALNA